MTTFLTTAPLDVRVRFHAGHLRVTASDDPEASATVEALDPADERSVEAARAARIDHNGNRLTVDVPGKGKWRGGVQVLVTLALPSLSKVNAQAAEVSFTSTGELAELLVRTGSGEVRAPEVRDLVDIKAGDASAVVGSPRRVSFTTGNGSLTAGGVGDVSFTAGHGNVHLGSSSGRVVVKGGKVGLDVGSAGSGEVHFETGSGNARVGVAVGTSVQLDLSSALGDVRCELPVDDAAPAGGSDLKVRLKTGLGDLLVARA